MTDHGLYGRKIGVGRGIGIGQHVAGIENIQSLVFHGPHIEVAHCDNHKPIQIQFQAEPFFVPYQRALQRVQRPFGFIAAAFIAVYL